MSKKRIVLLIFALALCAAVGGLLFASNVFPRGKSIPVLQEVPSELQCSGDSDCALNICECKAVHKSSLRPNDQICARACSGKPACVLGRCVLK